MVRLTTVAVVLMVAVSAVSSQGLEPPQQLTEAGDDLAYVELLNSADLSADQLSTLLRAQLLLLVETTLTPDVAAAFAELRALMLGGVSQQAAMEALGPRAQPLQQIQARYQELVQQRVGEMQGTLTEEQRAALAWHGSPTVHLENALNMIVQARQMPDDQWAQFKPQLAQMLSQVLGQAEGGAPASQDAVATLLESARGLADADFEQKRPSLAKEWATTLLPNTLKRVQDPAFQEQQAGQVCRRLLTYAWGHLLVQAKMDLMVQQ